MPNKKGPQKHSKTEMSRKEQLACQNAGGGAAGLQDRRGGAAGHAKLICPLCFTQAHDLNAMRVHHAAKHEDLDFDEGRYENLHEKFGGSTKGVAVHGSLKYDKQRR